MINRRIFNHEHAMFRDSVRKWAAAELAPYSEQWRAEGMVPKSAWKKAGEQGYLCMWAGEAYGGGGMEDYRYDQILIEELLHVDSGFFLALHNRVVGPYLNNLATDEQKARWLPGCVSGDTILSIAMTEPGTGSDLAGMKTRAEDKGDHWLLNGSKTYISNGLISNMCVVAARTNPDSPHAVGLFVVEEGMPGFKRGRKLKKLGLHSQDTAEMFFQDVKVPRTNVLGEPTQGFRNLMLNLAEERLTSAVGNVTRAERAFEVTLAYITDRKAFGRPIGTFQNSRFKMADMRARIDACWALVDHCVMEHVEHKLTGETAAAAKLYTSEVEGWVVDECLQLHGGAGYMDEYEICRLYADARISRIYAGTSEIMKEIIGRGLGLDERKRG
ncbi:MAG TPA: acyl-CoA dehydrogenase family protein [Steroidobacteraceae bacterium]|nr:acyl-CoA dehydrogenase family protein [Steroidobacteraceae bacterium]